MLDTIRCRGGHPQLRADREPAVGHAPQGDRRSGGRRYGSEPGQGRDGDGDAGGQQQHGPVGPSPRGGPGGEVADQPEDPVDQQQQCDPVRRHPGKFFEGGADIGVGGEVRGHQQRHHDHPGDDRWTGQGTASDRVVPVTARPWSTKLRQREQQRSGQDQRDRGEGAEGGPPPEGVAHEGPQGYTEHGGHGHSAHGEGHRQGDVAGFDQPGRHRRGQTPNGAHADAQDDPREDQRPETVGDRGQPVADGQHHHRHGQDHPPIQVPQQPWHHGGRDR